VKLRGRWERRSGEVRRWPLPRAGGGTTAM